MDMMTLARGNATCRYCAPGSGRSIFIGDSGTEEGCRDGHYTCARHATDADKKLLVEQAKRAVARRGATPRSFGRQRDMLDTVNWPYGCVDTATCERLLTWLEKENLAWSSGPTYHDYVGCTRWVQLGYCRKITCDGQFAFGDPWLDHVSYWRSTNINRWVMISQPYESATHAKRGTAHLRNVEGVQVEVHGNSWYGHGTAFVALWGEDH